MATTFSPTQGSALVWPLEKQSAREMRWIRGPFLEYEGDHGVVVVHGHTVNQDIVVKPNRIGLDTGAYETREAFGNLY